MLRRKFIKDALVCSTASVLMANSCSSSKKDTDIIILGGGFSGLYLAYLLDKAGKDYVLLEGSPRIGGRLYSHPVLKRDVGGRGIGDRYDLTMKIVNELGVELIDITSSMRSPKSIFYKDVLYPKWEDFNTDPSMFEFSLPNKAEGLSHLEEWYQRPDLDINYSAYLKEGGRTPEEIDLINISSNYNDVKETSAINAFHSQAFRKYNGSKVIYNFKGGSKNLINAITPSLSKEVLVNKKAIKISDNTNSVKVICQDGSSYVANNLVSTLPFSVLRDVDLSLNTTENQKQAINSLGYTNITQIHLHAKKPYWEDDAVPVSMWTDTPIERIMDMNPDPNITDIVCWVNGKGTSYFDNMSDKEIAKSTLKILSKMRPASEGKVEYIGTHNWGKYEFNKGAYAEFQPGQPALFEDMIKPAGNVHFAGEHTAKASRGIEGAAESAHRVYKELVA